MPYAISWLDDEQSMLMISADGNITWAEYHAINDQAMAQISALPHRVDLVFNSKVGLPPGNPLPHFRDAFNKWKAVPNLSMILAVESSRTRSFIKASADIAGRLMGFSMTGNAAFVATLDEAVKQIEADRKKAGAVKEKTTP